MARILVAEDEQVIRNLVLRALKLHDHEAVGVADGAAALEALARADEPFDLLLTDIVMPMMDGIALALKVSRDYPDLRILMMTGYAEEKRRAHNMDVLIHDVISKPFSIDQLMLAVTEALEDGGGEDA
jgi:two-component system cell cycle response regulator CpdR